MSEFKVHTVHERVVIPANHRADGWVDYHVCYGEVDWKRDGNTRPAIFVLMSYGGRINYQSPAHLTMDSDGETDFDKVYEALTYLKVKYSREFQIQHN